MNLRVTPYELLLESLEARTFPLILAEAEQRGTDSRRRDQFLLLGHVGAALKEIVPDDAPTSESPSPPPEALDEYVELLYQGFQFWSFGRRLYAFDEQTTALLAAPHFKMEDWTLAAPPACYLRFPYQRLWSRVAADASFEPVDGCFVVVDDTEPAPDAGAHLRAQLLLGVRAERPGVSLVSYRTDLDPRNARHHAEAPWRGDAEAFGNVIPGGERKGYKTVATTSELEALVIRALYCLERNSSSLTLEQASGAEGETRLSYVSVRSVSK